MAGTSEKGLNPLEQFYLLLPILVSSATLLQLPSASVHLLNKWRAIQLYDSQTVNEEEKANFKSQKPTKLKAFFYGLISFALILGPEVFLFATIDKRLCPTLTFLRDHIAQYYLCFVGLPLLLLLSTSSRQTFINRTEPKLKSLMQVKIVRNFKSVESFLVILIPTIFVFLTFYLPVETLIIPSLIAVLLSGNFIRQPATFRKFSSFRGLVLGPIIYFMLCAVIGTGLVALIIMMEKETDKDGSSTKKTSSNDDLDGGLEKLFYAVRPYLWVFCNFIPAALITLAYRYDSVNAGYSLTGTEQAQVSPSQISEESKTEVIKVEDVSGNFTTAVVLQEYDGQGKRAIQLSSVSLSRLSRNQTPIFNVGMLTFLAAHIGSILLAFLIPSDLMVVDRSLLNQASNNPSRVAIESLFSAFPPGWPSLILVPIAMMVRAYFTKEGVRRLWSYHEKWGVDTPKKAEEIKEKDVKHEEGQSLLADFE